MRKNNFLTVGNLITLGGIFSGLVILFKSEVGHIDLIFIIILSISDVFDGYVSRKRGEISLWGHFLDRILRDSVIILVFLKILIVFLGTTRQCWNNFGVFLIIEAAFLIFNLINFISYEENSKEAIEKRSFWFLWKVKQSLYVLGSIILIVLFF